MRYVFGPIAVICAGVAVLPALKGQPFVLVPGAIALVCVICGLLFHSLTVQVSRDEILLTFGIGLIRKRFVVADIQSCAAVRNRWYYGWGVKLTPHGWLYNVSGFDAVEIELRNGRKYRIGTDEPAELLAAIQSVTVDSE